MGLRVRRSVKIAPGLKLNIGKKSVGLTAGVKGAHYTINSSGRKTASVGIPGTGLSYVKTSNGGNRQKAKPKAAFSKTSTNVPNASGPNKEPFYTKTWFIILMLIIFFPVGLFLLWKYKKFSKPVRTVISAFFGIFLIIGLFTGDSGNDEPTTVSEPAVIETIAESTISSESLTEESTEMHESIVSDENAKESTSSLSSQEESIASVESTAESAFTEESISENDASENSSAEQVPPAETNVAGNTTAETVSENVIPTETVAEETVAQHTELYVLNTSTRKFHYSYCSSVKKIKSSNYGEFEGTRDEVIAKGYDPCGNCHP